jgi:hypothetical protein
MFARVCIGGCVLCRFVEERSVEGNNSVNLIVCSRQVAAAVAVSMSDDDPTGPCSES